MPRGWIDDLFESHPKRELVPLAADGVLMRAISIANRHHSDGFVSEEWMNHQLRGEGRRRRTVLEAMLAAPLFVVFPAGTERVVEAPRIAGLRTRPRQFTVGPFRPDGYLIHDFFACNRSRVELDEQRDKERSKKRDQRAQPRLDWDSPALSLGESPDQGTPGGVGGSTTNTEEREQHARPRPDELPAGPVGEVMEILARAPRFQVNGMMDSGVESAIAAHPGKDPVRAAHEAVATVADPAFNMTNPLRVLLMCLRKQPERAPGSETTIATGQNHGQAGGGLCRRCRERERAPGSGPFCDPCAQAVAA